MVATLSSILFGIRRNYKMYLDSKDIKLLESYINGFVGAKDPYSVDNLAMVQFREWLSKQPNITPGPSISEQIIQICNGEERAFELFFEYFDRFVGECSPGIPTSKSLFNERN
jgi:hypothetical protein